MEFHDVLHGVFELGFRHNRDLVHRLLAAPEIGRLRRMRLMNFDVPLIQELASAKRLPHSIGVCHLAQLLASRSVSRESDATVLMVAALLHDAAIPPYGHLVETRLRNRGATISHEKFLRALLFGEYHSSNMYHQILPGKSLQVHALLKRFDVDADRVLRLVKPRSGEHSAIAADVDLDNIDNVHRMAILLGWEGAKSNLEQLLKRSRINSNMELVFDSEAIEYLEVWQDFRQRIYTMIIAHPECVAYNAFQIDLVDKAIDVGAVSADDWFITDQLFEERLREHKETKRLAEQTLSGTSYRLVDYVWFTSIGDPPCSDWMNLEKAMAGELPDLRSNEKHFFWVESGLISRKIKPSMTAGNDSDDLGVQSVSCIVARVNTSADGSTPLKRRDREHWRKAVQQVMGNRVPGWHFDVAYPENYSGSYFNNLEKDVRQLELC